MLKTLRRYFPNTVSGSTRATPQKPTEPQSQKSDPAPSTEENSAGLRSIGADLSPNEYGEILELHVLKHYQSKGFVLIQRRYRTPFAEIDIVLTSPRGSVVLVEVKSSTSGFRMPFRVSKRQRGRLCRAHEYFVRFHTAVESHLAVVSQSGEIHLFTDYLGLGGY